MGFYSTREAAEMLGCSPRTVSRAAKRAKIGLTYASGRMAALAKADIDRLKGHIHESSGNPNWIAAAKKKKKRSKKAAG